LSEPTTANIGLIVPNTGDLAGRWGVEALNPDLSSIDGYLGATQVISVSNSPITLTSPAGFTPTPSGGPTQAQSAVLRFTGLLTAAVQVTLPLPGYMIIENLTTGNFVLSFRAFGSGQVIGMPQGALRHIYNDRSNVRFVNLPDPGSLWDLVTSAVPTWLSACTVPPWLNCDGSPFDGSTYPYLASLLGGTTLPDLRGVARYTLNQGTARLTTAASGLDGNTLLAIKSVPTNVLQLANLPPITPAGTITNGHITISGNAAANSGGSSTPGGGFLLNSPNAASISASQAASIFTGTIGGGTSVPFSTVATGTVSGITLIRAA
jgi:hypothetical protein